MRHWLAKLLGVSLACTLAVCGQQNPAKSAPAPSAGRGANERFYKVQSKLDEGGSFYLYSDLKGALHTCMDQVRPMLSNPGMPPQSLQFYAMADRVITRLGLYGLHDVGLSVVPDGGLNRTKLYLSAPEGREKGILAVLGGAPHALKVLDRAPSSTLVLVNSDFDPASGWALMRQIVRDIGGENGDQALAAQLAQVKAAMGVDLEAVNASLAGEITLLVDQDPTLKAMVPVGPSPLILPAPRVLVMVRVKDATLYETLKTLLIRQAPTAQPEATEGKLKLMAIPAPPNPFLPLFPVLATDGEYVYLSTHQALVKDVASPAGPLLRDSAEFKGLAQGLPSDVNSLAFISPRLGKAIGSVFEQVEATQRQMAGVPPNPVAERLKTQLNDSFSGAISIRINESDGVLCIGRSAAGAAQFAPAMMVPSAAILAAIAVPNFLEAQTRAKVARAKVDMRTMSRALESYQAEHKTYPAWTAEPRNRIDGDKAPANQPGFKAGPDAGGKLITLTTPVAYLKDYLKDPFTPGRKTTYSYWAPREAKTPGYILWSPGPDGQYDLSLDNIARVYDPASSAPSPALLELTYDPSNGIKSGGDIWQIKQ